MPKFSDTMDSFKEMVERTNNLILRASEQALELYDALTLLEERLKARGENEEQISFDKK